MRAKLEDELKRLTDPRLISLVDKPTDWVSNLVIATKKSGDQRICIDPKQVNKALRRERHILQVIDNAVPELATPVFTTLTLTSLIKDLEGETARVFTSKLFSRERC